MVSVVILIISLVVALLVVSLAWKLLKIVFKVALIALIAFLIFSLLTGTLNLKNQEGNVSIDENQTLNGTFDDVTAQVTGFLTKTVDSATRKAKVAAAKKVIEENS